MVKLMWLPLLLLITIPMTFGLTSTLSEFNLTTYYNGYIYDAQENESVWMDINVSVTESLLHFSDNANKTSPQFTIFNMSNNTGKIEFIPTNDDVGLSPWINIIIQNRSAPLDFLSFQIAFNITNLNNRPTIIATDPGDVPLEENSSLPLNITMDDADFPYGDTLSYNWSLDGNWSPKLTSVGNNATYTVGVNVGDVGIHIITVVVTDSGGLSTSHTWTITVTNFNLPPIFNGTIGNFSLDEDTSLIDVIILDSYFNDTDVNASNHDADTGLQLDYTLSCDDTEEASLNMTVDNANGTASFSPLLNFNGNKTCWFQVFDGFDSAYSNNFSVEVRPVNDPPTIEPFPLFSTYANADFTFQVNASDIENDTLRYYSGSSIFLVGFLTGFVNGTPGSGDVGVNSINISVDDGQLNTSVIMNVTVLPNEIPMVFDVQNQSVLQESTIFINVSAWDPLGDNLTLISDYGPLGTGNRYNQSLVVFNITPLSQATVGNHTIRITADDGIGRTNYTEFNLEVRDLPKDPNLNHVSNWTIRVNKTFITSLTGYDLDGNILLFGTNDTRMTMITNDTGSYDSNATGTMIFRPNMTGGPISFNLTLNDTDGRMDFQVIEIMVVANSAPTITTIFNITCEENELCYGTFVGSDADWQDSPTFVANDSIINLLPGGSFSFNPVSQFTRTVMVNLTDGDIIVSREIFVNITSINDPPYFMPPLENMTEFQSIIENMTVSFNITAVDEENATCNFSIVFLNFTDLQGNVSYSGIDIFTIVNMGNISVNETIGWINFTTNSSQAGVYWVNISAFDGIKMGSTIFSFEVQNVNNPPDATWTLTYTNYTTSTNFDLNVTENNSLRIDVSASDPDFQNMTFQWFRGSDGNLDLISTNESYTYNIGMHDAPWTNLTLSIIDSDNASTNLTWVLNTTNVNRLHWFGQIRDSVFSGQRYANVSNTSSITLDFSGTYALSGTYESREFDIGESNADTDRFVFTNFSYDATVPAGTSLTFQTRTREYGSSNYSNWTTVSASGHINSTPFQFVEYRAFMTSSGLATPTLHSVTIGYKISNISGIVGTILDGFLDLPDFFGDEDSDDTYTYQAYSTSLIYFLNATVSETDKVRLEFNREGIEYINFSCMDGDNNTVWSNLVTVNILPDPGDDDAPEQVALPTPSSGGGTVTKYKTRIKKQTEYVSLDIIHPGNVTFFEDDTMMIPVTIKNTGNGTLYDINISAISEHDFDIFLSEYEIEELEEEEAETIILTANLTEIYESFQILVRVDVADPTYTDTAKITINSLKRGKSDEDLFEVKYAFAKDLLQQNPICQELSEFLDKAREQFSDSNTLGGMGMLDDFIDDCRYLLSTKSELQTPEKISGAMILIDKIQEDRTLRNIIYVILFVIIFTVGFVTFLKYKNL